MGAIVLPVCFLAVGVLCIISGLFVGLYVLPTAVQDGLESSAKADDPSSDRIGGWHRQLCYNTNAFCLIQSACIHS